MPLWSRYDEPLAQRRRAEIQAQKSGRSHWRFCPLSFFCCIWRWQHTNFWVETWFSRYLQQREVAFCMKYGMSAKALKLCGNIGRLEPQSWYHLGLGSPFDSFSRRGNLRQFESRGEYLGHDPDLPVLPCWRTQQVFQRYKEISFAFFPNLCDFYGHSVSLGGESCCETVHWKCLTGLFARSGSSVNDTWKAVDITKT